MHRGHNTCLNIEAPMFLTMFPSEKPVVLGGVSSQVGRELNPILLERESGLFHNSNIITEDFFLIM